MSASDDPVLDSAYGSGYAATRRLLLILVRPALAIPPTLLFGAEASSYQPAGVLFMACSLSDRTIPLYVDQPKSALE